MFVRLGGWAWRFVAIAVAIWVCGTVFRRLAIVIVPITVALFLTTILWPLARFLRGHGWTRLLSTWAVFLSFLVVIAGMVTLAFPELHREFNHLGAELNQSQDRVRERLSRAPFNVSPSDFDRYVNDVKNQLTTNRNQIIDEVTASAELVLRAVAGTFLALVLTFFFLKDGDHMVTWIVELFDGRRAALLRGIGDRVWTTLTGYVRGTAVNGVVNASVISVGLIVLRVPLIIPIAIVTALSAFVPIAGAFVSGAIASLVALVTRGSAAALVVVGLTLVVHHLEGYFVGPFVVGRSVKLHPAVVLVSLSIGTVVAGLLGAFFAVPIVAIGSSVHDLLRTQRREAVVVEQLSDGPEHLPPDRPPPRE